MFGEPGFAVPYSSFLISDFLFRSSDCRGNLAFPFSISDFRLPISDFHFCTTQFELLSPGEPGLFISNSYFPSRFSNFKCTISAFESQIANFWVGMLQEPSSSGPGEPSARVLGEPSRAGHGTRPLRSWQVRTL